MSSTQPSTQPSSGPRSRSALVPRAVTVAVWLVPLLVTVQFAMAAVVPVAVVLAGALWDSRLRGFRPWAATLALTFLGVLLHRFLGPDPSLSLSRTMDPVLTIVVIVVSVAVAVASHVVSRRRPVAARDAG